MARKKINYLNNRDMLKEIHLSKMTFCYVRDTNHASYDLILNHIDEITPEKIQEAKEAKSHKALLTDYNTAINAWYNNGERTDRPKQADFRIDPADIRDEDIVFRIMTYEHIPEDLERRKNPKTEADRHAKVNFPPFKHYALIDGEWTEVARSHWDGSLGNGFFSTDHGQFTDELSKMILTMTQKYGTKGNWRSYTYNDEMQCAAILQLVEVALKFNEAKSDNPFSYFTTIIKNVFTRVLNSERKSQSIRDDILQENGYNPSFTRQLEDEMSQKAAREEALEHEKQQEEKKKAGYNY